MYFFPSREQHFFSLVWGWGTYFYVGEERGGGHSPPQVVNSLATPLHQVMTVIIINTVLFNILKLPEQAKIQVALPRPIKF